MVREIEIEIEVKAKREIERERVIKGGREGGSLRF